MLSAALVLAIASGLGIVAIRARRGSPTRVEPRRDLAVIAMQLCRGVRSGSTPQQILEESARRSTGPLADQLSVLCEQMQRGSSLQQALAQWQSTVSQGARGRRGIRRIRKTGTGGLVDPADVELLAVAARFGHRHGSGQAEVFEAVGTALLDRAEVADEVRALTAQARASVVVLCALPLLGALVLLMVDPRLATAAFTSPLGLSALLTALVLDLLALRIGSRLVDRAMR